MCEQLASLHDQVPPMSAEQVELAQVPSESAQISSVMMLAAQVAVLVRRPPGSAAALLHHGSGKQEPILLLQTRGVIERELGGAALEDVFEWIDLEQPLGSASLAQVLLWVLICLCNVDQLDICIVSTSNTVWQLAVRWCAAVANSSSYELSTFCVTRLRCTKRGCGCTDRRRGSGGSAEAPPSNGRQKITRSCTPQRQPPRRRGCRESCRLMAQSP